MEGFSTEFVKPFLICFDLLNRTNVYIFDKDISFFKTHWRSFFLIPCVLAFYTSMSVYMAKVFSGGIQFLELANIVPVITVATQGILKLAIVVSKRTQIKAIILQLGTMWRTNLTDAQIAKKNALLKRLNLCQFVFYWMNIIGSWQYILAPLFETLFRKFILQQPSELLLPFSCSYPFNSTTNPMIYIAVYIFQGYSMFHLIYVYLGAEFLMITLCAHLSTEFALLQDDLLHIKPASNIFHDVTHHESCEGRLGVNNIVRRHQRLIILSKNLDDIFNKMIFINLAFATITICFFGFVAKEARGPADMANNFVGVVASMVPIFNLCYYGQLLIESSTGIGDSAYQNLWYKRDLKHQITIRFIIERSQKPCCLTSLKYAPVDLNTFTTVLSTTWSYFSLANSLYEKKG